MELTRRELAGLSALALGATAFVGSTQAESADEATIKKVVDELRTAWFKQDKAKLESLTAEQLRYSHSDARLENKAKFIDGVMTRKATFKSLECPDLTVPTVGTFAVARHLCESEIQLECKATNTKI